jgi:hypothetical protein
MKHRSTHIFILLAAVMVAAPHLSQELSALRNAAARRVKAEIINAFLNLQAGAATRPAAPIADSQLASREATGEAGAGAKKVGVTARAATQVEVHARREVPAEVPSEDPAEVVMLTEPVPELAASLAEPPALPAPDYKFELHDVKVMRGRELAMLTAPDADIIPASRPAAAVARRGANEVRRAAARRKRAERSESEAASFVWRLGDAVEAQGASEAEVRGKLEALRLLGVDLRQLAPRTPAKAVKVKRTAKPAAAAPPAPPARVACPTRQIACGPSGPETLFDGE